MSSQFTRMQYPGTLQGAIVLDQGWVSIRLRDWRRSFPIESQQWETEMTTARALLEHWNDQLGSRVNAYSFASMDTFVGDLPAPANMVCMKAGEACDKQSPYFFFDREFILDIVPHIWMVHLTPQVPAALNVRVDANGVNGTTPSASQQQPVKQVIATYMQGCFVPLTEYIGKLICRKHKDRLDERFHRNWYHITQDESDFSEWNLTCKNLRSNSNSSSSSHCFETPPNPRLGAKVRFSEVVVEPESDVTNTPNGTANNN